METTKKKIAEAAALSRLANLCAKAEYCVSDIRQKMARWDLPEGAEDRIVHRLLDERYIDEQRYACAFVRSKFRFNRWGRDKIVRGLRQKGISDDNISLALEELKPDEAVATLKELLRAKARNLKYKDHYDRYAKLIRFALSRGFSMDDAGRCIRELDDLDDGE